MREVSARGGRTVLFVSHNLPAVRSLCSRALLLEGGRPRQVGSVDSCIRSYLRGAGECGLAEWLLSRPPGAELWMESVRLLVAGRPPAVIRMGDELTLEVAFAGASPVLTPYLGFVILAADGTPLLNANNRYQPTASLLTEPTVRGIVTCRLGAIPLMPGRYGLSLWFGDSAGDHHVVEAALGFEVVERDLWGGGKLPPREASLLWWPTEFHVSTRA
jgi:lipopolysaccharide transport system ATP-binding protein